MDKQDIQLSLKNAEALVLFEWVTRMTGSEEAHFEDQAEQRVLWDLEAALEKQLAPPFSPEYDKVLKQARDIVRDSEEPS